MTLITIDSSVYLSALIQKDHFHRASQQFFHKIEAEKKDVVLPMLIPLEVTNILYQHGIPLIKVQQIFESFYTTPRIRVIALDQAFGRAFVENVAKFQLKTSDGIIAASCFHFKATLVTWDKQLMTQTKHLLDTQTPLEWSSRK